MQQKAITTYMHDIKASAPELTQQKAITPDVEER
jgi:hypothetical protein